MARADEDLAFLLQYENVAWYENGTVKILDRRCYPNPVCFVTCTSAKEVADAIRDMVTQSAGPYLAAGMGMALAAWEARLLPRKEQYTRLERAGNVIATARPTTEKRMRQVTDGCLAAAKKALSGNEPLDEVIFQHTIEVTDKRYRRIEETAKHLVDKFPRKGAVMTQCFAETIVGFMCKEAKRRGMDIKFYCPETRPYFQGARLTASVIKDMGFDVTVITDNMPAWTMHEKKVDVFTCAADAITMDGWVVNKVGTLQISLAAKYWGIPVYVTGSPDRVHSCIDEIKIEERDANLVLEALGRPTTMDGVHGFYPAFDKTPPELITGIVTDRGIFDPHELDKYYEGHEDGVFEFVV